MKLLPAGIFGEKHVDRYLPLMGTFFIFIVVCNYTGLLPGAGSVFDVPTAIYSLINSVISSSTCDRVHTQNINVQATLVTKLEDTEPMEVAIMGSMGRGLTKLEASGRFTGENESLFLIVISKYEIGKLLSVIRTYDPGAFIILNENIRVEGHFVKKLT